MPVVSAILPPVLLAALLATLWWFLRGDAAEFRRFKALSDTGARQARYWRWIVKAVIALALPALAALALLGRLAALATTPIEFAPAAALIGPIDLDSSFLTGAVGGAAIGGALLGTMIAIRRKKAGKQGPMVGDIQSLLPRNRAELLPAALLSVSAGVTEELFFRLALPLLLVLVTGSAVAAFAVPTLLFGLAHRYQGWAGVAATTAMGVLFSAIYLAGGLWVAIACHAAMDLNGLVLRPLLMGAWRRGD